MRRAVEREREREKPASIYSTLSACDRRTAVTTTCSSSLSSSQLNDHACLSFLKTRQLVLFPIFLLSFCFFFHALSFLTCSIFIRKYYIFFFFFFLIFSILFFSFWCSRHYTVYSLWALDRNVDHGESFAVFIQQYSEIQQHCSRQYIAYSVWKYSKYF